MDLGIIFLIVIIIALLVYIFIFKEYSEVMANFKTLVKIIETRDLLLLRVLPEIKDKKNKEKIQKLIAIRMDCKKKGNDALIKADVDINKNLKPIYDELNKTKNPIAKEEFRRIINLEKKLKIIRKEYSEAVEKYNKRITKRPKFYIKAIRMKPLNSYEFKQ